MRGADYMHKPGRVGGRTTPPREGDNCSECGADIRRRAKWIHTCGTKCSYKRGQRRSLEAYHAVRGSAADDTQTPGFYPDGMPRRDEFEPRRDYMLRYKKWSDSKRTPSFWG